MASFSRILMIAFPLALAFSASAEAAAAKPAEPGASFSLTPMIGALVPASGKSVQPAGVAGVKATYDINGSNIAEALGVEATLNYFSTATTSGAKSASGYMLRADALYSFTPTKKWNPFITLGLGGVSTRTEGTTDNRPLLNYGAGIKYTLENYLALRLDLRYITIYSGVNPRSDFEVTGGVTYTFGKERKKKAAPPPPPTQKAVPILEEPKGPSGPLPVPDYTLLEKLGATGTAVMGLSPTPPQFQPKPPAQPGPLPLAFKPAPPAPPPALPSAPAAPAPAAPAATAPAAAPSAPAPAEPAAEAPAPLTGGEQIEVVPPAAPAPTAPAPAAPVAPPPAAPQQPAPQVLRRQQAPPTAARKVVKYYTVEFDTNSSVIAPKYAKGIAGIAALIKSSQQASVLIEGHTDWVGKHPPNLTLSLKRAESVRSQLVQLGVDPAIITIKGYGASRPIASNQTEEGRQKNRRAMATIKVVTQE